MRMRGIAAAVGLVGFFFLVNWWMLSNLQDGGGNFRSKDGVVPNLTLASVKSSVPVSIAHLLIVTFIFNQIHGKIVFFLISNGWISSCNLNI